MFALVALWLAPAVAEPPAPAPAAAGELFDSVATKTPRAELAKFLVARAQKAAKARDWAHAIPLYQALVVARGPGSAEASSWRRCGRWRGRTRTPPPRGRPMPARWPTRTNVMRRSARPRVSARPPIRSPTSSRSPSSPARPSRRSRSAALRFASSSTATRSCIFISATRSPRICPASCASSARPTRSSARSRSEREFYRRYLAQRPFGVNADVVRAELAKDRDVLGTLLVSASLPCSELWINRQRIVGKLPDKGLLVAPGSYKGLCFNPKYEMALFEYTTVEPGKPASLQFRWAIVVNELEHPLGRIALENPKAPGTMIDLGITATEVGVAVAADGRKLKMIVKDDTATRVEERMVQIDPGQKFVVKW